MLGYAGCAAAAICGPRALRVARARSLCCSITLSTSSPHAHCRAPCTSATCMLCRLPLHACMNLSYSCDAEEAQRGGADRASGHLSASGRDRGGSRPPAELPPAVPRAALRRDSLDNPKVSGPTELPSAKTADVPQRGRVSDILGSRAQAAPILESLAGLEGPLYQVAAPR